MPSDALVIAPAILSVVLVVSAVGKLRSPTASAEAFWALKVPRRLRSPIVVSALPWVEIVLGLALVVVGGWLGVVVSLAVLALFCAYLALVVRARGFETDVDCACFGSVGPGKITRLTVWRNTWLLALAAVSVVVATTGDALLARLLDGTAPWQWLVAAAAAALTVLLVLGTESTPADQHAADAPSVTVGDVAVEEGDYLRSRTPAVPITFADGSRAQLRELSLQRAQLLLYVSDWCSSCHDVVEAVPRWREALGPLDVRLVLRAAPGETPLTSADEPQTLHDTEGLLNESFGMRSTPSAILLGADGLLAGGPVVGRDQVLGFVDDIAAELRAST